MCSLLYIVFHDIYLGMTNAKVLHQVEEMYSLLFTVFHDIYLGMTNAEVLHLFKKMCSLLYTVFHDIFLGMTNAEVLHQVEHGYRMQSPQGCPPLLYDIMLECWHKVRIFILQFKF